MAKPQFRYTAELKDGTTLHRKGIKHRRGVTIPIDASDVQDYRNSGRFVVSEIPLNAAGASVPSQPGPRRPRSETRARQAARAPDPTETPEPVAPVSPARLEKLAAAEVSTKMGRPTLETMATQLGATGPDGESPEDAPNKPTLVKWIEKRQGEVLADLQGDDPSPSDDDGDGDDDPPPSDDDGDGDDDPEADED